jgi:hypothetical protein
MLMVPEQIMDAPMTADSVLDGKFHPAIWQVAS